MSPFAIRFGAGFGVLLLLAVGCGQLPNPNDLKTIAAADRPQATARILQSAKDYLEVRVEKGEISDQQRNDLLRQKSTELAASIDSRQVSPGDLWIYGDLLASSGDWPDAVKILKAAVDHAKDWDRRVNDTLRYASALAQVERVPEAIHAAKTIMDAPDRECAPILPATLYELVPAAEGRGSDPALADLLEQAIACHKRTEVDLTTPDGKAFQLAKAAHIGLAERKIAELRHGGMIRA